MNGLFVALRVCLDKIGGTKSFSFLSITGSAVCAFYMDDIEKVFNGKFKEQRNSESAWTPVPDEVVPKPR